MNDWPELDRFLRTDPRDVGCAQAMDMLHVYVDLVVAGAPVEERARAGRAARTSRGCWPRSAARRTDRPAYSPPAAPDRGQSFPDHRRLMAMPALVALSGES
jgi:hypothetical protein